MTTERDTWRAIQQFRRLATTRGHPVAVGLGRPGSGDRRSDTALDGFSMCAWRSPDESGIKAISDHVDRQRHFSVGDDGRGKMVERDEAAFKFLVGHQQLAESANQPSCPSRCREASLQNHAPNVG